jgi:prepilin-type N-terminal cleavage/methylation domain-containing protein
MRSVNGKILSANTPRRGSVRPAQGNALGVGVSGQDFSGPSGQWFAEEQLGRWPDHAVGFRIKHPGRCPGLGERRAFGPNSSLINHPSSFRRGVTLVEMLIVVTIIAILMGITLRTIRPTGDRRTREAARAVNVYLSSARNLAMDLGRPCGVIFRRATGTNTPSASITLDQCEVPPPYAGDVINAAVKVQTISTSPITLRIQIRLNDFSDRLIRIGDLMQIDHKGLYYELSSNSNFPLDSDGFIQFSSGTDTNGDGWIDSNYLILSNPEMPVQTLSWPVGSWSNPVAFQILRQPDRTRSSVQSLQLPAGTVVDLDFSGTDSQSFTGTHEVKIIFSGNGSVEGYYFNGKHPVTDPIFLLIGSRSRVRDFVNNPPTGSNSNELPNWADLSSLWITINNQTGLVATSENSTYAGAPNWADPSTWLPFIIQTRKYAQESQSMGGR